MVYIEQTWTDSPAETTPVSAARLTHLEAGVKEASDRATVLEARPIINSPDDIGAQPVDADLTAIAALTPSDDAVVQRKAGAWTGRTPAQLKTDLVLAKADVGLSSVDNTADTAKPVSTAQQTALDGKLSLTGGTLSGILNASAGLGVGTAAPAEAVDVDSTTSVQRRIRTISYQETESTGMAETIRLYASNPAGKTGNSAKNAIAWYADDISTTQAQVWVQAHDYLHWYNPILFTSADVNTATDRVTAVAHALDAPPGWQGQFATTGTLPTGLSPATNYYAKRIDNDTLEFYTDSTLLNLVDITAVGAGSHTFVPDNTYDNNRHRHWSVEVSNADLTSKNTRLSIPWGYDTTEIGTFQANVNVNDGQLRINGAAGSYRQLQFGGPLSDNLAPSLTNIRWSVQANNAAESGGNVGSDFRITRYSDTGVALDAPLSVKRSNGYIGINNSNPLAPLDVGTDGTVQGVFIRGTAAGTASIPLIGLESTATGKRVLDYRVIGDGVSRIRFDTSAGGGSGTLTFGDGTSADTNLYRSAADTLKTDDNLVVVGTLTMGGLAVATDAALTAGLATKQPLDADLTAIAALAPPNDDIVQRKAGAWTNRTPAQVKTDLVLVKADVGLSNADNTSDANKPVSTAQQTALDLKLAAALVDTKGDILAATAADTVTRLAVGADDFVLTADSSTATGLKWAAGGGGGAPVYAPEAARYGCKAISFDPHSLSWVTPQYIELSVARHYQHWLPLPVGTLVTGVRMPVQLQAPGGGAFILGVYQDDNSPLGDTGNVAAQFQDAGVAEQWVDAPLSVAAVSTGPGVWVTALATTAGGPKAAFCNTDGSASLPGWLLNPSSHPTCVRTEGVGALPGTLAPGAGIPYIDFLIGVY